jgi:hypothetical protein
MFMTTQPRNAPTMMLRLFSILLFDAARLYETMTAPTMLDDSQIVLLIP